MPDSGDRASDGSLDETEYPEGEELASAGTVAARPEAAAGSALHAEVLGGRYALLAELGRGGEGVVYRATDLKADAIVALKLLRRDAESDDRLGRFRRELQMARRVTHPNVVRIHDLVELPGRYALSMELVEGEPLDARIGRGPLTAAELDRLALDLAGALSAAHRAGVTHRDLKPGNVLLRSSDGGAMVTDFGVSRLHGVAEGESRTATTASPVRLTREGALVGTPLYMAPEQLEGRTDIGPAADVYALGVLLYEAATGHCPLDADTVGELRRLRLAGPAPPLSGSRPDLPAGFCGVVDRALATRPEDRFGDGGQVMDALASRRSAPPPAAASTPRSRSWLALAPLALIACVAVVYVAGRAPPAGPPTSPSAPGPSSRPAPSLQVASTRRLTFGDGCEEFPTLLPDGQTLLYGGSVGADEYIFALGTAPGSVPRALTHVRGWDTAPRVSPAGDRFAFLRFDDGGVGVYVAPVDGHEPPRFLARGNVRPGWSRDGRGIWVTDGSRFRELAADTGAEMKSYEGPRADLEGAAPLELPDGSLAAIVEGGLVFATPQGSRWRVARMRLDEAIALAPDGRHVLVSVNTGTHSFQLLAVPLDDSEPSPVGAPAVAPTKGLALTPDGRRLFWSTCATHTTLARVGSGAGVPEGLRGSERSVGWFTAIPGTAQIAETSDQGGPQQLWVTDASGQVPPRAIDIGRSVTGLVAVSPDGQRFAVAAVEGGLYTGKLVGPPDAYPLTAHSADGTPTFTADGQRVVFERDVGGRLQVMDVGLDGGEPRPLVDPPSWSPSPSPVDGRVAFLGGDVEHSTPMMREAKTGILRPISAGLRPGHYSALRFSPDGKRLVLVLDRRELYEVDASTGALLRSVEGGSDSLFDPGYLPGGLAVERAGWRGNLWMADATWTW